MSKILLLPRQVRVMRETHSLTHAEYIRVRESEIDRVRTDPGKPGKYWNLIIRIPGLEYTGISS